MDVVLYGAPWCAFCKTEKQWLDSKGVKHVYKDIEESDDVREELESLGHTSVPVTVIDGEIVKGFDRVKLSKLLGV